MVSSHPPVKSPWNRAIWAALLGMVAMLFLMRGGIPVVLRLVRFLWPIVVIYIAYRGVRAWWQKRLQAPTDSQGRPVIEICPKCGRPQESLLHICRRIR